MTIKFKSISTPKLKLEVRVNEKHLWSKFHDFHYMTCNKPINKSFPNGAKFYTFYWNDILVGCCGVLFQIASYPAKRLTRVVVLPEFQGLGISTKIINSISEYYSSLGFKMYISTFHDRLGGYLESSKYWTAGMYNQKTFRKTGIHVEKSMSGLRDGEAMYRYTFSPGNYTLIYSPVKYDNINRQMLEIEKCMTPDKEDEYLKLRQEMKDICTLMEFGTLNRDILYANSLKDEDNIALKPKTKPKISRKLIKETMKLKNISSIEAIKLLS